VQGIITMIQSRWNLQLNKQQSMNLFDMFILLLQKISHFRKVISWYSVDVEGAATPVKAHPLGQDSSPTSQGCMDDNNVSEPNPY